MACKTPHNESERYRIGFWLIYVAASFIDSVLDRWRSEGVSLAGVSEPLLLVLFRFMLMVGCSLGINPGLKLSFGTANSMPTWCHRSRSGLVVCVNTGQIGLVAILVNQS